MKKPIDVVNRFCSNQQLKIRIHIIARFHRLWSGYGIFFSSKQLLIPPQAEQPSRQSSHLFSIGNLAGCYPPYWATGRASWLRHPAYQEGVCHFRPKHDR